MAHLTKSTNFFNMLGHICKLQAHKSREVSKTHLKQSILWANVTAKKVTYVTFSRNSIVDLLKRRENTLSLFGVYENLLVKFYYCQKVKIEKCYRVRTAGRQNYRFYRDLKWNTR